MKFQERVIHEQVELNSKIKSLWTFIKDNPAFEALDKQEKERLGRQLEVMREYNDILNTRIAHF